MEKDDQLFIQLLYIFHSSAMQAFGKLKNPITGKIEKNLDQAKQSIDMLKMLKEKTVNNLTPELTKALDSFLTEVKLNYVDEVNKN
jgi:hypothetical protein